MQKKILAYLLGGVLFFGGTFLSRFTLGAAPQCGTEDGLQKLAAVREDLSLDYLDSIKKELAVRKEILSRILGCATDEATNLQANLLKSATVDNDPELSRVKTRLEKNLEDVLSYYAFLAPKISDFGLQGSKDFSRNLLAWRLSNFEPQKNNVTNFVIWMENRSLINTADHRFADIARTTTSLKLNDNDTIKKLLDAAAGNLGDAKAKDQDVRRGFIEQRPSGDIGTLMQSSMEALAATYQSFFDLSEAVNELIPTK